MSQIQTICEEQHIPAPSNVWDIIVRLPDTTQNSSVEVLTDEEWSVAKQAISQAVAQLQDFRKQEGAALMIKFNEKLTTSKSYLVKSNPMNRLV